MIVYLDGQEVVRNNVAADAKEAYDLFASEIVSGEAETKLNSFPFTFKLPAGEHVVGRFGPQSSGRQFRSEDC